MTTPTTTTPKTKESSPTKKYFRVEYKDYKQTGRNLTYDVVAIDRIDAISAVIEKHPLIRRPDRAWFFVDEGSSLEPQERDYSVKRLISQKCRWDEERERLEKSLFGHVSLLVEKVA